MSSSTWNERILIASKTLEVPVALLTEFLARNGIDHTTALPAALPDFQQVLKQDANFSQRGLSPFKVNKAWQDLCTIPKEPVLDATTPAQEVMAYLLPKVAPERRRLAMKLLSQKRIRDEDAATWATADFVVLKTEKGGVIDLEATRLVMATLERGSQQIHSPHRVFTLADGTRHVVHPLDEISVEGPRALRLRDPLQPGAFLDPITRVSQAWNVLVDLPDDRHQLLLFAISAGIKAAPRDETEARDLLTLMASAATTEEAAKRLGDTVLLRWQAAQFADPSSPAALPAIRVEATSTQTGSSSPVNPGETVATPAPVIPPRETFDRHLQDFPSDLLIPAIQSAKADQIRFLIEELGETPRGSSKLELAKQLYGMNPSLTAFIKAIIIDPLEGRVCEAAFEAMVGKKYQEWRDLAVEIRVGKAALEALQRT